MARSPGDPRTRYIAFAVETPDPPERKEVIRAIQAAGRTLDAAFEEKTGAWLTRYNGAHGIIRCHHTHRAEVTRALAAVERTRDGTALRLVPLATSGTVRTLIERHVPGLKEPRDTQHGPPPGTAAKSGAPRRRSG